MSLEGEHKDLQERLKVKSISLEHQILETDRLRGMNRGLVAEVNRLKKGLQLTKRDADFLYSVLPRWVRDPREGLDPTFYHTGSYDGDLLLIKRINEILYGPEIIQAQREGEGVQDTTRIPGED